MDWVVGAALICLSATLAGDSRADAAACPSPIPLGLATALTRNLALFGTRARNGAELRSDCRRLSARSPWSDGKCGEPSVLLGVI